MPLVSRLHRLEAYATGRASRQQGTAKTGLSPKRLTVYGTRCLVHYDWTRPKSGDFSYTNNYSSIHDLGVVLRTLTATAWSFLSPRFVSRW